MKIIHHMCVLMISISNLQVFATEGSGSNNIKNQLDKACNLAERINDEDIRYALLFELKTCKNCYHDDSINISERITTLYEGVGEVLADCDQDDLKEEIFACIGVIAE